MRTNKGIENVKEIFFIVLELPVFVAASHQTRLDTRSKARRPIKVGIKGRGRSGTSRDSNPACLCCSSAHLVQCEPDEASSFTNPNVGPGTYASLRLKLDAWSSAVQGGHPNLVTHLCTVQEDCYLTSVICWEPSTSSMI